MTDPDDRIERLQQFSQYVWQGRSRGMSRREFLRQGLRLGLSLPAIAAVLTGCGVGPPRPLRPPTPVPGEPPALIRPTAAPAPTLAAPAAPTAAPTSTPVPQPVRFAVIGDFGMAGPAAEQVAGLVKSWSPEFVVTTGDNNYPSGEAATLDLNVGQYYREFFGQANPDGTPAQPNRFFPVLGNHDSEAAAGQPYLDYFTLAGNERYYIVDRPPVRIFALNSVPWIEPDGAHPESIQAEWLRRGLAESPDTWNLAVFHHPPYSSDHRGSNEWMRWPFKEWGADAVLCGHNHVYERVERDGFPYLINGLGGGARYAWGEIVEGSVVRYNAGHGAMLVEALPDRITFQFVVAGTGEVIDTYRLER
jgi:tartrate-resistant acid phosphatase type 5